MTIFKGDTQERYICAIYTRTSHQEKGEVSKYDTIAAQREHCEDFIRFKREFNWQAIKVHYNDRNYSGGTLNRPALKRLLSDAREGKFNMIVIRQLDRLTRSIKDFYDLWNTLQDYGIALCSTKENLDSSTPIGKLYINLLVGFAQFERELAGDRTRDKMRFRASKGLFHGGYPPLGYDFHPKEKGILRINKTESNIVRIAFKRYLQCQSANEVVKYLNKRGYRTKSWITKSGAKRGGTKFTKGVMLNLLKKRAYIGRTFDGKKEYKAKWKGIVTEKNFRQVQNILKENRVSKTSISQNKYNLLLPGLVWCGHCKSYMSPNYTIKKKTGKKYLYYQCTKVGHGDKTACKIGRVPARPLEKNIINRIKFLSENRTLIDKVIGKALKLSKSRLPELKKEQRRINGALRKLDTEISRVKSVIGNKNIEILQDEFIKLDEHKKILDQELRDINSQIEQERSTVISPNTIANYFKHFNKVFDTLSFENQRDLLRFLIKKITYHENKSKISISFWNLPEIKMPPNKQKSGLSGGSTTSRFDKRKTWLPDTTTHQTTFRDEFRFGIRRTKYGQKLLYPRYKKCPTSLKYHSG